MVGYALFSFVAVLLGLGSSGAMSAQDKLGIREALQPFFVQCSKEYGINEEQFEEAKKKGSVAGIDPCFMSCFLKKAEFFDSKGMFDVEKTVEFSKAHANNEEALKFFDAITQDCPKVNEAAVSDGEEGCERAMIFFQCLHEHKQKFNLED